MTNLTTPTVDGALEYGVEFWDVKEEDRLDELAPESVVEATHRAAANQLVSIRMPQSMIDSMKAIAAANGNIGYQTLIKQLLQRFIEGEKKRLWNEYISAQTQKLVEVEQSRLKATSVMKKGRSTGTAGSGRRQSVAKKRPQEKIAA